MSEVLHCCVFLLFLTRVSSGVTGTISKYGCKGDSIELFQNISFNIPDIVVSLYKNGEDNQVIAMWTKEKSVFSETFSNGYSEKVFLDKFGCIWIRSLNTFDEGKYTLQIIQGSWTGKHDVYLSVLVAPTTQCKPKIIRSENTLFASLPPDHCGKPAVTVYWLEHSGISYRKDIVKLLSGSKGGTYHACVEGPALTCARSSKLSDFCEVFWLDLDNIYSSGLSETTNTSAANQTVLNLSEIKTGTPAIHFTLFGSSWMTEIMIGTIICIPIIIVIFLAVIIMLMLRRKKIQKRTTESDQEDANFQLLEKEITTLDTTQEEIEETQDLHGRRGTIKLPKGVIDSVQSPNDVSAVNCNEQIEETQDLHGRRGTIKLPKQVLDSVQSPNDVSAVNCNDEGEKVSPNTNEISDEIPATENTSN